MSCLVPPAVDSLWCTTTIRLPRCSRAETILHVWAVFKIFLDSGSRRVWGRAIQFSVFSSFRKGGQGGFLGSAAPKSPQAPHCSGSCPSGSLCLVLGLTAPGGSRSVADPSPTAPTRGCVTAVVWSSACGAPSHGRWAGRPGRPASAPPSASRCSLGAAPLALAASCTPTSFCTSFSLHDSAQQEPSAAPPALQALLYQSLQAALIAFESALQAAVPPEQPQQRRLPVTSHPSCLCPAARACCRQGWLAAGRPQHRLGGC